MRLTLNCTAHYNSQDPGPGQQRLSGFQGVPAGHGPGGSQDYRGETVVVFQAVRHGQLWCDR